MTAPQIEQAKAKRADKQFAPADPIEARLEQRRAQGWVRWPYAAYRSPKTSDGE